MKLIPQFVVLPVLCMLAAVPSSPQAGQSGQGMISGGATALPRPKPSGRPWPVSLSDVAEQAGIRLQYTYGHPQKKKYVIEANGAGVAFLDYNGDGLLDVFLVNGSKLESFPPGAVPTNHLYRNEGKGKFSDVTRAAGMDQSGWGNGVCAGDFDNDGHTDLYVTYFGKNLLQRNNGDGTFTNVAERSATSGSGKEWSTGCTFVDYDRDGHLDLLVTRYLNFQAERTPLPGAHPFCMWKGSPVYCGPRGLPFGSLALYHNRGDGTFEDVSIQSGISAVKGFYAFTAVATDFDGDGWPDLYIACDSTPSILFHNQKNGTFRDIGTETGLAYNDNGSEQAGMGLSVGDYDNDGRIDILKTNFTGDYPNLYHNLGKGLFSDVCLRAGLAVNPDHVLWGTAFVDLDNDGWKDILQVSGHVYPEVAQIDAREHYRRSRLVYRNLGNGRFEDVSEMSGPGIAAEHSSRGVAIGDFDNDGAMDALVMNMHEAPSLLRNDLKSSSHWVKLRLRGVESNRDAIGAVVTVEAAGRVQADAVLSQSSFLSHHDLRLHFGLGAAAKVDRIVVQWPSGKREEFAGAAADALYLLVEGTGQPKTQELPK
ncbi:CRTAC1 family protein [uncultured Paludibaculum sp.]|uniref:CRTAC1 family protein n=1 Tax=uncultured Paludibaculum sp. TaxID=1765020 RepID=UPI002AAACE3D|nr:CRTAC1 family protein [uncultured Paludibaculum sp.]